MAPAKIEVMDPSNPDLILGQLVQAVNGLIDSNKVEHENIARRLDQVDTRLDEGDKYLVIFKASKCTFDWLDKQGLIKAVGVGVFLIVMNWVGRYFL